MHKHMQFWSNFEITIAVVTVNIRSNSIKSNSLFSVSKQITCIYASLALVDSSFWFDTINLG